MEGHSRNQMFGGKFRTDLGLFVMDNYFYCIKYCLNSILGTTQLMSDEELNF